MGSVIVINLLLGWTFVGWVVSMAMASRSQLAPVQVNVNHPPSPTGDSSQRSPSFSGPSASAGR
jgi:hypothetical protein